VDEQRLTSGHAPPSPRRPRRRFWAAIRAVLRTRIAAGLVTVIPIWITYEIVRFVFNFAFETMKSATEPLARKLALVLQQSPDPRISWLLQNHEKRIVPVLAILLTLFLLYLLGLLGANVVGSRIIAAVESVFERLPLIKTVYRSIKQIVIAIGGPQSMHFQRVVLIDFPAPGMKRVAFLTSVMTDRDTGRKIASIFIPYTPYLTTGYMQLVPLDDVSETNWTVEEAIKWVVSGGLAHPETLPFDRVHPVNPDLVAGPASAVGLADPGPREHATKP
jgi:uncharacterized membrane protein